VVLTDLATQGSERKREKSTASPISSSCFFLESAMMDSYASSILFFQCDSVSLYSEH